ncbi:MAG: hypothetical protein GC192_05510 [Bacteroidetes bacterium]|nr:hypothetical protein [Bacteroidota bacterium]
MTKMKILIRGLLMLLAILFVSLGVSYILSGNQAEIVNTVEINKSPNEVIDFISDMRNELKWNPDLQFMEKKSPGPIDVGTVFRAKWHMSDTLDVTVTQFYPPYSVTFENGGAIEVVHKLTLTKMGDSTRLESQFMATPHGFARAIFPTIKSRIEAQEKKNMKNLKKALEGT